MRLFIVRHAKAERDSPSGSDDDRALTDRGERQARYLGAALGEYAGSPALVSSPILRARRTAEAIARALRVPVVLDERLSTRSGLGDVLELLVERAGEAASALVIVGHNPTFSEAALALSRPGGFAGELRTGECVALDFAAGIAPRAGVIALRLRLDED